MSSYTPSIVTKTFSVFPLSVYPGQHDKDNKLQKEIEKHTFPLRSREQQQDRNTQLVEKHEDSIVIGVYKVKEYREMMKNTTVYLPTDPLCLNVLLSMMLKNDLLLPKSTCFQHSKYSVVELSYHASPDGALPMLVEPERLDSKLKIHTRNPIIRTYGEINNVLAERLSSENDGHLLLAELMDTIFYDVFIMQLLKEPEVYASKYVLDSSALTQQQNYNKFMLNLMNQNRFSIRNQAIHNEFNREFIFNYARFEQRVMFSKNKCVTDCKDLLEQIEKELSNNESNIFRKNSADMEENPFTTTNSPSYLDLKLASYIVPMLSLGVDNDLSCFLEKSCPLSTQRAKHVISYFS
ncbi:hypothetical protein ACO0RG_000670 [Hanseniaspora osmophila]